MAEKMLVTQALDERELLEKKIEDKIEKLRIADCKKRNEEKTINDKVSAEEFAKNAASGYQQIMDLIDRYQRLVAAVIASNAATFVESTRGRMSVAAAIALRTRLKTNCFENLLARMMEQEYRDNVSYADNRNKSLESQAESMRLSILGKDSKVKDDKPLEVVEAYIRENTTEVMNPLDAKNKAQQLREQTAAFLKELETLIKVSNATTMIEF